MAAEHWFRWHHGTVTDPKWVTVAKRASNKLSRNVTVGHVVSVWAAMMENASQSESRGWLSNWSDEDIGNALGMPEEEVEAIRHAMQGKTLDLDMVTAWKRRQPKAEDATAAARKRAQRERDKSHDDTAAAIESRNVTGGHDRDRGETEENLKARDSLRSSSSTAAPPPANDAETDEQRKARRAAEAADRLAAHTDNAMAAYNETLTAPKGVLSVATKIGIDKKRAWVKRCIAVAKQISETVYGDDAITADFWREYFAEVAKDPFKSGQTQGGKGHEGWAPDFEYLTRADVMTEVFEKAMTETHA